MDQKPQAKILERATELIEQACSAVDKGYYDKAEIIALLSISISLSVIAARLEPLKDLQGLDDLAAAVGHYEDDYIRIRSV